MHFEKLTHAVLRRLKMQGYNILRSPSLLTNEDPTYFPDIVDLEKFFDVDSDEIARISVPMQELHLLVIDDALKNISDEDLTGMVWVE